MENLYIQQKGSINVNKHEFDSSLDEKFKPGLYLQVKDFLSETSDRLVTIQEHIKNSKKVFSIINNKV